MEHCHIGHWIYENLVGKHATSRMVIHIYKKIHKDSCRTRMFVWTMTFMHVPFIHSFAHIAWSYITRIG